MPDAVRAIDVTPTILGALGVSPPQSLDGESLTALLSALEGVDDRRARYVCELVALGPDGERRGTGVLEGTIAPAARW